MLEDYATKVTVNFSHLIDNNKIKLTREEVLLQSLRKQ